MKFQYPLLCLVLLSIAVSLQAQQFGGSPPAVRWRQINTDTVRVIFPAGLEQQAKAITGISHGLAHRTIHSIGERVRKINIVLQNQTVLSNAYVGLGPYRSEFQLTPDPNSFELGSLPWEQSLAIHEYRHVQQFNNFRRGIASAFYVLFGEEGQGLANSISIPDWFFEGDAVYQETEVSKQGRGRLPYFFNAYRSLWSAGKNYSWMKLRNGSLRDFVPDHYRLGYMLVAYGREKYGDDFWKKVTSDAAAWRGLVYPFQKAVQKYSGKSFKEFRRDAFGHFSSQVSSVSPMQGHFIANQEYPHWVDSSTVVYLKTSYNKIPSFTMQSKNAEKRIRSRDAYADNYFSYRNGKIVYASYKPDIRWGWRDYSELQILDLQSGVQRRVTKKTKYFSPDISADAKQIVAVHVGVDGNSSLHLLNAENGSLVRIIPNPDRLFFTYPKFFNNDKVVTAVRNKEGQMSIAVIELNNNSTKYILPFAWTVIGFPSTESNSIYFTASLHGTDKVFRWENDLLYLVEETASNPHNTGDYQLNVLNEKLVWTRFTANGYLLTFGQRSNNLERKIEATEFLNNHPDFGIHSVNDSLNQFLSEVTQTDYNVTPYAKSTRLFNFHSRRPYISDPEYSFAFVSENILNTLQAELSGTYNRNERFKQVGFSALYGGWFPMARVGTQYTFDRNAIFRTNAPRRYWNELESSIGVSVPLNLSMGRMFRYLTVAGDYVYNKRYHTGYYKDSFENRAFGYMNASLSFSNQIQKARQHIYPRFAQTLLLNYKRAVTTLEGNQFLASGNLYLPGVFVNHNLVLQVAWHKRDTLNNIRFSNSFPFSRGYTANNFFRMVKLGGNYHFPLAYPDWGMGNIVYFLRVRTNVFFDYSEVAHDVDRRRVIKLNYRSFGSEIFFDTRWWNQLPLSFGFRYSRLLDPDIAGREPNQFEFILPVNLLQR